MLKYRLDCSRGVCGNCSFREEQAPPLRVQIEFQIINNICRAGVYLPPFCKVKAIYTATDKHQHKLNLKPSPAGEGVGEADG